MSKSNKNKKVKWIVISDYPNYKVSEDGNVLRIYDDYEMTMRMTCGYYTVSLSKNSKTKQMLVHRLVAKAFIPNPKNLAKVDHIDNNPFNNHVSNLRWISHSNNIKAYHDNFKEKRIILQYDENKKLINKWSCLNEIIKKHPTLRPSTLHNNLSGHNRIAYGYIWRYEKSLKKRPIIKPKKNEIFKKIPKIKGSDISSYYVSNRGNIKNNKGLIMSVQTNRGGYKVITLVNKKKHKKQLYYIHKLVAYAFIVNDDPENNNVVNHKDSNISNNTVKNLEWTNVHGNNIHGHGIKVKMIDLKKNKVIKTFDCISQANVFLGLFKTNKSINKACKGHKNNIAHGYKWEYNNDDILTDIITMQDLMDADKNDKYTTYN